MITAWMLYAMIVGGFLAAGGWVLERFFHSQGLPARWIWVGCMLLTLAWPLGHWAWEQGPAAPGPTVSPTARFPELPVQEPTLLPTDRVVVSIPPESLLRRLDRPVLLGWGVTTGTLVLFFAVLLLRTRRLARGWERRKVGEHPVLISDEWGPAVVGIFQPRIVLPAWCLDMGDRALGFILAHELEHLRAGDLRLMTLMGGLAVVCPWNPLIWWQLSRLRTAVEADCDSRVLRIHTGQVRPYLHLLLEVGHKAPPSPAFAAMLSEPYATLKRRIKIMTQPLPKRPWVRGGVLVGGGGLLVAVACLAPGPTDARNSEQPTLARHDAPRALGTRPRFTPHIVKPLLRNPEAVTAALEEAYRTVLAGGEVEGTVQVWYFLDEDRVVNTIVNQSSGYRELDNLALQIADIVEFSPALNRDRPVPVWVSLPVEFIPGEAPGRDAAGGATGTQDQESGWRRAAAGDPVPEGGPSGEIRGRVTDGSTGQPLGFVQVFVPYSRQGTLTDSEGQFILEDVPEGVREVFALMPGFGEVALDVTVVPEQPAEVGFQLQPEAIVLEKLIVSGGS